MSPQDVFNLALAALCIWLGFVLSEYGHWRESKRKIRGKLSVVVDDPYIGVIILVDDMPVWTSSSQCERHETRLMVEFDLEEVLEEP